MAVWGAGHAEAQAAVAEWLQKRGLIIIGRHTMQQMLNERLHEHGNRPPDEKVLLQAAGSLGADLLVFVDTSRIAMPPNHQATDPDDSSGFHSTSVLIRGVDVKTGDVEWMAQASYSPTSGENDGIFVNLACQALATTWGFRPAGYHEVSSSDMCEAHTPSQHAPPSSDGRQLGLKPSIDRASEATAVYLLLLR